tara:strand:- start:206 stop:457 length:252 start_codon:yes stop_codon:yes gene_type:complete
MNIKDDLLKYVLQQSDMIEKIEEIPLDKSLLKEGILDSFGIIELVEFVENKWELKIEDEEFNVENFGSIEKIINLIDQKIRLK